MRNVENILAQLACDLKKVDQIILEFAVGKSPLIAEISNHLISSGGKRIRPILLILAAKLCGAKDEKNPQNLAAAVELIHSATLLHDDVVDASQVRRGKKTANALWDNKASILVGDYLFSIAFQLMVRVKNLEVLGLLAKASSIMADGEVMQLENSSDVTLSQEKYFEIIFGKTAVLFAAACESGALVSEASNAEVTALREFGTNLGIIFQIVDDMLDYSSDEKTLGKDVGNDFFEGKVTLPVILLQQKADKVEQKFISDVFTKNLLASEHSASDLAQFLELLKKHEALEACKNMALKHQALAVKNLEIFSNSDFKKDLITILDYSLARIF
ncbi:MAG: polyprenyl synthetase family protein [Rickettsiales bacterium]|nr:polyprenyl synthetase family protein [Rickettsiales bacterium]